MKKYRVTVWQSLERLSGQDACQALENKLNEWSAGGRLVQAVPNADELLLIFEQESQD